MTPRAERRRAEREDARLDGYVESKFWPMPSRTMHGVCRFERCNKRTHLTLPLKICRRHMPTLQAWVWVAGRFGVRL